MLTMGRFSYGSAWESAWYPGEASGEAHGGWFEQVFFPSPFFLWWMHSFSCPWFSHEVFYTVMSFNEASEDTGFFQYFSSSLLLYWPFHFLFLSCVPLHLPYEGKCQNNGRQDMTDRRRRPEMTDRRRHVRRRQLPESPSPGSGESLPSFPLGESLRPVVYRENVLPSTMYQSMNSLSSSLSIPIFQQQMGSRRVTRLTMPHHI